LLRFFSGTRPNLTASTMLRRHAMSITPRNQPLKIVLPGIHRLAGQKLRRLPALQVAHGSHESCHIYLSCSRYWRRYLRLPFCSFGKIIRRAEWDYEVGKV
jgi:hypothetical protein